MLCPFRVFTQDDEDEKEAEADKEKFEAIKAKIEAETEKAKKRAERFGAEFTEPSIGLILDQVELNLYYKITQPKSAVPTKEQRAAYRSQVPYTLPDTIAHPIIKHEITE